MDDEWKKRYRKKYKARKKKEYEKWGKNMRNNIPL